MLLLRVLFSCWNKYNTITTTIVPCMSCRTARPLASCSTLRLAPFSFVTSAPHRSSSRTIVTWFPATAQCKGLHTRTHTYRFLSGCGEAENRTLQLVAPRNFPQPRNTTLLHECHLATTQTLEYTPTQRHISAAAGRTLSLSCRPLAVPAVTPPTARKFPYPHVTQPWQR